MILILFIIGISAGIIVSGGICALFTAVEIIDRISYKFKIKNKSHIFEKTIFMGAVTGNLLIVFFENISDLLNNGFGTNYIIMAVGGFMGIFVGCLAMSIEEALDVPSIFFRKLGIKHHLRYVVLGIALGKLVGNIIYFIIG